MSAQSGIAADVPKHARYLRFRRRHGGDVAQALRVLAEGEWGDDVLGVGPSVAQELSAEVPGLHEFPGWSGTQVSVPSTPGALWLWLRGDEPGRLLHRGRELSRQLQGAFELEHALSGFFHEGGRDLTGYEDGTENPTGDAADQAAFVRGAGEGLDGSSFVALQQWVHDLDHFEAHSESERDDMIGRRRSDNEELDEAPDSAHVKRTAQEDFDPEAFVLRRSMPWAGADEAGLVFVAFGRSFDAFEAQLRRMVGLDDGIVDALFRFTRPVTGSYFWCPPIREGRLDLRALGL